MDKKPTDEDLKRKVRELEDEGQIGQQQYYLTKAQEMGKIGTWELDLLRNELIWTEQNYHNFGVPLGTPMNYEMFLDCIHPDDRDYVNTEWIAAIDGKPYDIEHRLLVDGKVRWVREKAAIHFNEKGKAIKAIGFTQDITERKEAERTLLKSEERYRLLFSNMLNGFALHEIVVDENNKPVDYIFLAINNAFETLTGLNRNDLIGKKVTEALPGIENDPFDWIGKYGKVAQSGEEIRFEQYAPPLDRWFSIYAYQTEANQFAVIFEDMTKRKKTEETLQETNKNLKESMSELKEKQEQLIFAEKMASLGQLVAGIAHEINTPIGVGVTAASYAQSLSKETHREFSNNSLTKSKLEEYINNTEKSSELTLKTLQRASELIGSFKLVAADQTAEKKRTFNVKEYIQTVINILEPERKKREVKIALTGDDDLNFYSSPGLMGQIITNLVINSITHAFNNQDDAEISIDIKESGENFIISCHDNGSGISPENLKRIFEPFYTTNRAEGGTGLGLHIVFNIVHNTLKGEITCESKENRGTNFVIKLPKEA